MPDLQTGLRLAVDIFDESVSSLDAVSQSRHVQAGDGYPCPGVDVLFSTGEDAGGCLVVMPHDDGVIRELVTPRALE